MPSRKHTISMSERHCSDKVQKPDVMMRTAAAYRNEHLPRLVCLLASLLGGLWLFGLSSSGPACGFEHAQPGWRFGFAESFD